MSKIIVSLVGVQTIPNVLFIRELMYKYPRDKFKFLFITTKEMEEKNKTSDILRSANITDIIPSSEIYNIIIPEDAIHKIKMELDMFAEKEVTSKDEFFVNLTGGTKIMSLSVYDFFKNKRASMYYLTLGKNTLKQIYPHVSEMSLTIKINLIDYFTAYGIKVNFSSSPIIGEEYTNQFFLRFSPRFKKIAFILRKFFQEVNLGLKDREVKFSVDELPQAQIIKAFLDEINFPLREQKFIYKYEIEYLIGKWFEEYIYFLIKKLGNIEEDSIGTGIQVNYNKVINEFDVVFIYKNRPFVVECKTGLHGENRRSILNETLYKISALKANFGLSVKPFLFALADDLLLKDYITVRRAKVFGITLVSKNNLRDKRKLTHLVFGNSVKVDIN